jgi:hypothetical protein
MTIKQLKSEFKTHKTSFNSIFKFYTNIKFVVNVLKQIFLLFLFLDSPFSRLLHQIQISDIFNLF